jgi:hypothetical protein
MVNEFWTAAMAHEIKVALATRDVGRAAAMQTRRNQDGRSARASRKQKHFKGGSPMVTTTKQPKAGVVIPEQIHTWIENLSGCERARIIVMARQRELRRRRAKA